MRTFISLFLLLSVAFLIASCGKQGADDQTGQVPADSLVTEEQATQAPVETEQAQEQATPPPAKPKKEITYVTIPESTAVAVILVDSIDTDIHTSGTEFKATLSGPILVNGRALFEAGAEVKGVLNRVVESGRLKTPAELDFSLTAIQDKKGQWTSIETYLIQEKKGSHTTHDVALIGGGAVVGGIIGKVIDKKGSTTAGAAIGAAAGTAAAALSGKQDISHPAGTPITFFLRQSTEIALE